MQSTFSDARGLFLQGVEHFEAGEPQAALERFQASLQLLPGRVSTLTNLAAAQIALHQPAVALESLEQALATAPDDTDAWWHRGIALTDLQRFGEALAAFDRVLVLQPGRCEAWVRHGQALQQLDRPEDALRSYDKALSIDAGMAPAWTQRGNVLKDLGRCVEAAQAYRKALAAGGDAQMLGYFLAAVEPPSDPRDVPAIAPAPYVQALFDNYAQSFDTHLVEVLHYQAHTVLVAQLAQLQRARFKRALDLGCGTGLCGPLLRPLAEILEGVDLSQQMLEQARTLQVYAHLVQADLVQYLRTTDQRYDLVLAADVFIYIGDLAPLFGAVAQTMDPQGLFCFSIETPDGTGEFELKASLRYGQSEAYVRRLAAQNGFELLTLLRAHIRQEKQQDIAGLYVVLRKCPVALG